MKWTAYDDDVLPLWVAETDFDTCPAVKEAIQKSVDDQVYGYPSIDSRLADALTSWCSERYGWDINPAWVHDLPDVLKGLELAIELFTVPGTPIVLPMPAYMPFFSVLELTGRRVVPTSMIYTEGHYEFDFEAIEEAFDNGAGGIILCNPYNPLGATFSADVLERMAQLAHKYSVKIISDEIHAPLVYDATHIPTASVSDTAAQVTVTLTATSKGFNTPGLKCAQIILTNDHDAAIWKKINMFKSHGAATMGIEASIGAYTQGGPWLDELMAYLKDNRDYLAEKLPEAIPGIGFRPPQATYLGWLDFSGVKAMDGMDPTQFLLDHARVAINPGEPFGPGGERHGRLNFGTSRDILDIFLERTSAALQRF